MNIEYFPIGMFFISFYGLIISKNIVKSIVSIGLMEMAVIMFIVSIGFKDGMRVPIGQDLENVADPLPQALVITAIIIGITVAAVNLTMLISLYRQHKSTDWDTVKKKNMEPVAITVAEASNQRSPDLASRKQHDSPPV